MAVPMSVFPASKLPVGFLWFLWQSRLYSKPQSYQLVPMVLVFPTAVPNAVLPASKLPAGSYDSYRCPNGSIASLKVNQLVHMVWFLWQSQWQYSRPQSYQLYMFGVDTGMIRILLIDIDTDTEADV